MIQTQGLFEDEMLIKNVMNLFDLNANSFAQESERVGCILELSGSLIYRIAMQEREKRIRLLKASIKILRTNNPNHH